MGSGPGPERPWALDPDVALDQPLERVIAEGQAKGKASKVSVDLRLYSHEQKTYIPWRGVTWKQTLASVEQGRRLAEAVDLLVRALALSPMVTLDALREIVGGRDATPNDAAADDEEAAV